MMDSQYAAFAPKALEQCLRNALHELGLAVMLVDDQAKLMYVNRTARAELMSGQSLRLRGDCLCAALETQQPSLTNALAAARAGRRSLVAFGRDGESRMHAVIPVSAGGAPPEAPLALLMSALRDPFASVTLTLFAKAAGLTASEHDVLISLCRGVAANEIAAQRAVRISTIRTQIGSIREKVGARSLTQLIRKVSALPPMSLA
jgi:DNA-binding CsgD family transcriptional regulator